MNLSGNRYSTGRPCFFSFIDEKTQLYWMIPISSQVEKYKVYYNNKIVRYGKCDTILFGDLLGYEKAFLIQNMCPTTNHYIENNYLSKNKPVEVDSNFKKELISKAKTVLAIHKSNPYSKLILTKALDIEKILLNKN
jgi:hypothetical protein